MQKHGTGGRKSWGDLLKIIQHSPLIFFMICGGKVIWAEPQCEQVAEQSPKAGVMTPGASMLSFSSLPTALHIIKHLEMAAHQDEKGGYLFRTAKPAFSF